MVGRVLVWGGGGVQSGGHGCFTLERVVGLVRGHAIVHAWQRLEVL